MNLLLLFRLIICEDENINIIYADDKDLYLSVVKGQYSSLVRLFPKDKNTKYTTNDVFTVNFQTSFTTLQTKSNGYICGKEKDPGVVACPKPKVKSMFNFKDKGGFVVIIDENGDCLTKAPFDSLTGGFYLNLRKCNGRKEQNFLVKKIETHDSDVASEGSKLKESEDFLECPGNNRDELFAALREIEALTNRLRHLIKEKF